MVLAVLGTPSALTYWVEHCVRAICVVLGDVYFVRADSLDTLRKYWAERGERSVVLISDLPKVDVVDLLIKANIPLLIVMENPRDVVGYVMKQRKMDAVSAIRLATQSLCLLSEATRSTQSLVIGSSFHSLPIHDAICKLIAAMQLPIPEDQFDEIAKHICVRIGMNDQSTVFSDLLRLFPASQRPGDYEKAWPAAESALIKGIVDQYSDLVKRKQITKISWAREAFANWDRPGEYLIGPISLVGPRRFIIWGPYLHLPRGSWEALIEIEVAENFTGNILHADIAMGGQVIAGIEADLPQQGCFEFSIEFTCVDPYLPTEVRFELLEGAIEGQLLLRSVRFTKKR